MRRFDFDKMAFVYVQYPSNGLQLLCSLLQLLWKRPTTIQRLLLRI